MMCPSCNKTPASFLRFSFSLQGVSFTRSVQGYFKCEHCGTLLRVTNYGKQFWILFTALVSILVLFVLLYQELFTRLGSGPITAIWIFLLLLTGFTFTFGLWKFAHIAAVQEKDSASPQ